MRVEAVVVVLRQQVAEEQEVMVAVEQGHLVLQMVHQVQ